MIMALSFSDFFTKKLSARLADRIIDTAETYSPQELATVEKSIGTKSFGKLTKHSFVSQVVEQDRREAVPFPPPDPLGLFPPLPRGERA